MSTLDDAQRILQQVAPLADYERRATMRPNGLPLHIADTKYYLRMVNNSGFEASAEIGIRTSPLGEGRVRIALLAEVTTFGGTSVAEFVSLLPEDGSGGPMQWHVFQEARRIRRKGTAWKIGSAMFRFEIFPIQDI